MISRGVATGARAERKRRRTIAKLEDHYITLSARSARPDLLIVARAADADAPRNLHLAGADRVVQPYSTAGKEMAKLVLKPQVAAFLDAVSATGGASGQAGRTIEEINFRSQLHVRKRCPTRAT